MRFFDKIKRILSFDEFVRLRGINFVARRLLPGYRLSWNQLDWFHDEDFNAYLRIFDEESGLNTQRRWTMWQLLRLTAHVEGDTAECGVWTGASSWLICAANRSQSASRRRHHMFDSFEGLSTPDPDDGDYWQKGNLSAGEDLVARNLAPFIEDVSFHKGWIPDRFNEVEDQTFSFVHVDVDLGQPTADSLAFFYDRLNPGGIFLCDDYGFRTCPAATRRSDEFLAYKPEKMVSLASGGGFFVKGTPTAASDRPLVWPSEEERALP